MQSFLRRIGKIFYLVGLYLVASFLDDISARSKKQPTDADTPPQEDADSPVQLSGSGWKRVLKQTKQALKDKDLATTAAGLAYYATLTFFPAVLGLATVTLIFTSPEQVTSLINNLSHYLPAAIAKLLSTQLTPIVSAGSKKASLAVIVSVAALIWTTSGGLQNLIKATNKVYDVKETRNMVKLRLTSAALSIVLLVFGGVIILLLLLQKNALQQLGFPSTLATLFPLLRWPILLALLSVMLATIYRYAPDRKEPHWQWVSWGATAATVIWLIVTVGFFIYVQNFANFNRSYGSLAGIVVLMIWFNYSALIILVGAQVNKRLEVNTSRSPQKE
jgi:membrane protein